MSQRQHSTLVKKKLKIKKSKITSIKKKMEKKTSKQPTTLPSIKLIDIKLDNIYEEEGKAFRMQLFGMNEIGKTYSIVIDDFKPFFFVKIPNRCLRYKKQTINEVKQYINYMCNYLRIDDGKYLEYVDDITFVKRHKLYGFDNNKEYIFLKITFPSMHEYNAVRRLWMSPMVGDNVFIRKIKQSGNIKRIYYEDKTNKKLYTVGSKSSTYGHFSEKDLKLNHSKVENGLIVNPNIKSYLFDPKKRRSSWKQTRLQNIDSVKMELYESALPPFLRFFHIQQLSPSGWVTFKRPPSTVREASKLSNCDFEYESSYKNVIAQPNKESAIPIKIASYDIEASSSHGDFPLPKKTYKKFLGEMIELWNKYQTDEVILDAMLDAFSHSNKYKYDISKLYPKPNQHISANDIRLLYEKFSMFTIEQQVYLSNFDDEKNFETLKLLRKHKKSTIMDVLTSTEIEPMEKQTIVDIALTGGDGNVEKNLKQKRFMPYLEGDTVTFIGTTFIKCNEDDSYLNHMIVLNSCNDTPEVPNREIETYDTEAEVLLAWTNIINREDPDIIIGYNIFGFDWKFMLDRADELNIKNDFIKMSRNKCIEKYSKQTRQYELKTDCMIKNSTTTVASGTYEDTYLVIPGRLQIDLLNYFRKEVQLPSYKLDYVASHFISDYISDYTHETNTDGESSTQTVIKSSNLMGLKAGHFVSFEIIAHSSDMYENGKKFKITYLDPIKKEFTIDHKLNIDKKLKMKWCLNKDDINHHQIFEYTNQGPDKRAIIAKYCFQDCNLCHTLMKKYDILTGVTELASICSVPMSFIIMRGQGIKLLSFIAKQCREMKTLMPAVEKSTSNDGYEGAIVLDPKTGFYADDPVACVDYSSLYPSCMISENISHDSKVWTKEYDLSGNFALDKNGKPLVTGLRDASGQFVYDNLPNYKYVNVKYDTFTYKRPRPNAAAKKIKTGFKICRYAQFPDGKKAIMPSVLSELLASRKATRKLAKHKIVTTKSGKEFIGLLTKTDTHHEILQEDKTIERIENNKVDTVEDRFNDFMKNVLDKRQLSKKIVANSLYGQCGAKTSAFYEKDIAASTTATGRKLLIYGKNIIEKCYTNHITETKHGKVKVNAEYVYGDTDSIFFKFNPETLEGEPIRGQKALEITIELAIEAGELATKYLKLPHDLEYEKTFMPFLLLSKKRYVGMLYELNPHKCKRKSMGIVLKRRDNAPIVKDCYGGIIDILMKEKNVDKAVAFTKQFLLDMIDEKFSLDKLIISKSLRQFYKNPNQIAHKVLAERIGKREPGNKPAVGSRIPFVYIQTKGKPKLQGDRIEDPNYIRKHNLQPDFSFYITNQIQKPVMQVFCLVLEQITEFRSLLRGFQRQIRTIKRKYKDEPDKAERYETKEREKHVNKLIFQSSVKQCSKNKKKKAMNTFFSRYN